MLLPDNAMHPTRISEPLMQEFRVSQYVRASDAGCWTLLLTGVRRYLISGDLCLLKQ
jgi:hypothetical protein